jgi:hypothetical protein
MTDNAKSESSITPLFHSGSVIRRKAGRPRGSKAQVVQDARALGVHHFAFVRSSILGLDLADSFAALPGLVGNDYRPALCAEPQRGSPQAHHRGRAPARCHACRHIPRSPILLDLLRSDAATPKAVELPTLDEWIASEGMDPDGWSGGRACWQSTRPTSVWTTLDAIEAASAFKDPVAERVRALNYLETVLSVVPSATDRLESWFARPVVKCLRNMGIITLGDLVRFINAYGHRWYSGIKGFGEQRAKQVVHWLVLEQDQA